MNKLNTSPGLIETLLKRNLQEVFAERNPVLRRKAIGELWTADGIFSDPHGYHIGHDALDKAVKVIPAEA